MFLLFEFSTYPLTIFEALLQRKCILYRLVGSLDGNAERCHGMKFSIYDCQIIESSSVIFQILCAYEFPIAIVFCSSWPSVGAHYRSRLHEVSLMQTSRVVRVGASVFCYVHIRTCNAFRGEPYLEGKKKLRGLQLYVSCKPLMNVLFDYK